MRVDWLQIILGCAIMESYTYSEIKYKCRLRLKWNLLLTLVIISAWNIRQIDATSESPFTVSQERPSTCVTCNRHEQMMAKLSDLKDSARSLNHRMQKVSTKIDDLEQCGCLQK